MFVAIIIIVLFAALAIRNLKAALILLAGLLPLYLLRFSIGPIPTTTLEGIILTAFAVWLIKFRAWKINYRSLGPYVRPLLLLIASACFAVVIANDTIGALGIWKAYFIEPAMVFVMMRSLFKTRKDWTLALKALGISAAMIGAFAIFQAGTGLGIPSPWDLEHRATSIFSYPNAAGLFLAPVAAIAIILAIKTRDRFFWPIVAILCTAGVIAAQTEAAFIAIPGALLITLLASDAEKKIKIGVSILALIALVALLFFSPVARQKLTLQDYSGQVRLSQWFETSELLSDNIPFGVGLSEYPNALTPYHDPTLYEIFQYPHNIVLNIWVELGLLGLFAFFWLASLSLKSIHQNKSDALKLAAFAALSVMVIHGLVDVPYFKNDLSVMVWILIAIMSAVIPTPQKNS